MRFSCRLSGSSVKDIPAGVLGARSRLLYALRAGSSYTVLAQAEGGGGCCNAEGRWCESGSSFGRSRRGSSSGSRLEATVVFALPLPLRPERTPAPRRPAAAPRPGINPYGHLHQPRLLLTVRLVGGGVGVAVAHQRPACSQSRSSRSRTTGSDALSPRF